MTPKIAFMDLEGTLFKPEVRLDDGRVAPSLWTVIADSLGQNALDEENATKDKWLSGGYGSYVDWMQNTVPIHKKHRLSEEKFRQLVSRVEFEDGIDELFDYFKKQAITTCIITGGFKELADRVAKKYKVDHVISACEYIFQDNYLSRATYFPSDYFGKVDFMKIIMREHRLSPFEAVFIGDGKNDVPLAQSVAVSIGFNAQQELADVCTENVSASGNRASLKEVANLLLSPTQKMRLAIETDLTPQFLGKPKNISTNDAIQLWKEAMWVRKNSHSPYSKFRVGAAVMSINRNTKPAQNEIFTGCNFENASYGATICAERAAIGKMISSGTKKIDAIAVVSDSLEPIPPCGICRQVIDEFAKDADVLLCSKDGKIVCETSNTLLPQRFNLVSF